MNTLAAVESQASPPGLVFGHLIFDRRNVFDRSDPLDKMFPYNLGNKIHITTKENTIRQEILFKEGQPYSDFLVKESERLLRMREIFRYATITPETPENGHVDILIRTEDAWSTSILLGFGAAGGKTFYRLGVMEHNFLGWGDAAGAFIRKEIDRTIKGVEYKAPNLLGSRLAVVGGYGVDETGHDATLSVVKPFYSVITQHSEGASFEKSDDQGRQFENGDEVGHYQQRSLATREFFSWALEPRPDGSTRLLVAHDYKKDQFSDIEIPSGTPVPENRTVSALLGGVGYKGAQYTTARGVRTFDRDEDMNLAWDWTAEAGPSLEALGATRNGLLMRGTAKNTWRLGQRTYYFLTGNLETRVEEGQIHNAILRAENLVDFAHREEGAATVIRNEIEWGRTLDPEQQFLLGGENGLRGYSVRQFSGSKKILFSVENREVIARDVLNLTNWGWATFAETGAMLKPEESLALNDFKSDVGVGIRFSPSRSTDPSLIRIDLAYALDDNNLNHRWVLNIGGEFKFGETSLKKYEQ